MSDETWEPSRECVCARPILVDEAVFNLNVRCIKCGRDYHGIHSTAAVQSS